MTTTIPRKRERAAAARAVVVVDDDDDNDNVRLCCVCVSLSLSSRLFDSGGWWWLHWEDMVPCHALGLPPSLTGMPWHGDRGHWAMLMILPKSGSWRRSEVRVRACAWAAPAMSYVRGACPGCARTQRGASAGSGTTATFRSSA